MYFESYNDTEVCRQKDGAKLLLSSINHVIFDGVLFQLFVVAPLSLIFGVLVQLLGNNNNTCIKPVFEHIWKQGMNIWRQISSLLLIFIVAKYSLKIQLNIVQL